MSLVCGFCAERGKARDDTVSAVSPVLANLFLHYAFDTWLEKEFPSVSFERFADLCRARHKSAYADYRVMPRRRLERCRWAGSRCGDAA